MSRLVFKSGLILSNNASNVFPTCNSAGDHPIVLCGMIRTDDTDDGLTPFCLQKYLNSCDRNAGPLFVTIVAGTPYLANHSCNFSALYNPDEFMSMVLTVYSRRVVVFPIHFLDSLGMDNSFPQTFQYLVHSSPTRYNIS
ncbi:hypothetical protein Tsp_10265 [Trichinella spiralis]|uniref:hypothetical protein n=1 Tax=Trichinella spiralis TaxID=6334 RepID=UPI0001EFDFC6|nr:hypothetical protein Tsp_10265 [Trichinella spiralis]